MLMRFVSIQKLERSRILMGVFMAAETLRDNGQLDEADEEWYEGILDWFNRRLRVPPCFFQSALPDADSNAICWFKTDAHAHIGKIRELLAFLEHNGVATRLVRTTRPGYVVYEDDYQVAAVPFRDTFGRLTSARTAARLR
jgi:hypothetical protein